MKNVKVLLLLSVLISQINIAIGQDVPPGRRSLKVQECDNLNTTIRDTSTNAALMEYVKSMESTGFIKFDLEKMQNNGDLEGMQSLLGIGGATTFVMTNETTSPANPDVTFVTAQQYYNGVLVEGGSYIQGLINCNTFFMNAYILENINIGLSPSRTKQTAISDLESYESGNVTFVSENPENDIQLVIDQDLTESCDYILAWKVNYLKDGSNKTAYVNTNDGTVYKETDNHRTLNAPTADYGNNVDLDNWLNVPGTFRFLKTSDLSVVTFDKSGTNEDGLLSGGSDDFTVGQEEKIPSQLTSWPTTGPDGHHVGVYQAHYVVTEAKKVLDPFGLNFPNQLYVAGNVMMANARYVRKNTGKDVLGFGTINGKSTALFDIAGHEITHMHLFGKFGGGGEIGGIEEGICDIFGEFAERNCPNGITDWIAGGHNGLNKRNLKNPTIPNYFPTIGEVNDLHEIGGPITRWFTILVDGGTFPFAGTNYVVPSIDIEEATSIVLNSIPHLNSGSDYIEARAATIMAAELIYGDCSEEAEAIATAWYAVGVGYPGHCNLIVEGAVAYCEEHLSTPSGNVEFTMLNTLPNHTYEWVFPYGWKAVGQSASQHFTGTHLSMYEYSYMPNFPRYYSIYLKEYDQNHLFKRYRHISVKINDCDADDPQHPCADNPAYLNINEDKKDDTKIPAGMTRVAAVNDHKVVLSNTYEINSDYKYSIYDVSGRVLVSGNLNDGYNLNNLPYTGIYILHVYNEHRKLVQTEKIFHIE